MNRTVRKMFEEVCYPNFSVGGNPSLARKVNGEYASDVLEDHWQTFQEGWECAINSIKRGHDDDEYSDLVSDGGLDPRGC